MADQIGLTSRAVKSYHHSVELKNPSSGRARGIGCVKRRKFVITTLNEILSHNLVKLAVPLVDPRDVGLNFALNETRFRWSCVFTVE